MFRLVDPGVRALRDESAISSSAWSSAASRYWRADGARIPRREHEPCANTAIRWEDIHPGRLREGTKFSLRLQLEFGQLTWSTVMQHRVVVASFAAFLTGRGIDHPALVDDPDTGLRTLALEFTTFPHAWRRQRSGPAGTGGALKPRTISKTQQSIDMFYRFIADNRVEAARALGDRRSPNSRPGSGNAGT